MPKKIVKNPLRLINPKTGMRFLLIAKPKVSMTQRQFRRTG